MYWGLYWNYNTDLSYNLQGLIAINNNESRYIVCSKNESEKIYYLGEPILDSFIKVVWNGLNPINKYEFQF